MTKPKDADAVMKMMKDKEVKYVDLRFTDPRGKMQHVTMDSKVMDEEAFTDGIMFDGSSIAGWKVINESDMKLMPDPNSAVVDPFFAQSTLAVFCDVLEPLTNEPYERDPRSIAAVVSSSSCFRFVEGSRSQVNGIQIAKNATRTTLHPISFCRSGVSSAASEGPGRIPRGMSLACSFDRPRRYSASPAVSTSTPPRTRRRMPPVFVAASMRSALPP